MRRNNVLNVSIGAIVLLTAFPVNAQLNDGSIRGAENDSIRCMMDISSYREFYKKKRYDYAHDAWRIVFDNCPDYSERIFVDGVNMYRAFIEEAPEDQKKTLVDTLMLIYDRRMEYFGGEGNVLGRKAQDLLTYRGDDIRQVRNAYDMLSRSVELEGIDSRDPVLVLFLNAGAILSSQGELEDRQVIGDYLKINEIIDEKQSSSSRKERVQESLKEILLNGGHLSCESLNDYYDSQFDKGKDDRSFLEQLLSVYSLLGCDRADMYVAASESLYQMEPSPEAAHELGLLFISKNDFEKAADYLKEAIQGQKIDRETHAIWYFELALVGSALKNYCETIEYAREAIALDNYYGKAYILLGDAFIASRETLGDDFQQRTAFWAAVDMYSEARSVDPGLSEEADQKIAESMAQFPDQEEIFFRDLKEGSSYRVEGCIDKLTSVRSRKN